MKFDFGRCSDGSNATKSIDQCRFRMNDASSKERDRLPLDRLPWAAIVFTATYLTIGLVAALSRVRFWSSDLGVLAGFGRSHRCAESNFRIDHFGGVGGYGFGCHQ